MASTRMKAGRLMRLVAAGSLCAAVGQASCDSTVPAPLPPPVAGLRHPEMARVGQGVAFTSTSVVATGKPGAPGTRIARFRFTFADGTPAIDQAAPTVSHAFAAAGSYAVAIAVVDDRGLESTATSVIHVVPDFSPTCPSGTAAGCVFDACVGDVCAVLACAGPEVCPAGAICAAARCQPKPLPDVDAAAASPGSDAGVFPEDSEPPQEVAAEDVTSEPDASLAPDAPGTPDATEAPDASEGFDWFGGPEAGAMDE